MPNKLIVAGMAALGCLVVSCATGAEAAAVGARSPEWNKSLKLAVNDTRKAAAVMQAIPEAARATFAAEVLAALQAKRQRMADKLVWAHEFAAIAAGLAEGSGGAKDTVLAAVPAGIVNACVDPEARELTSGSLAQLSLLAKSVAEQLKSEDRVAFANALLLAVNKQKATDAGVHKQAMSVVALSLFAGAGTAKDSVLAEAFAVVDTNDLGAVAQIFSDAFNQRNNGLSNDEYLQTAQQILQKVAARLKNLPDVAKRFAYAVSVFLGGAANPAQFEQALLGKLTDPLVGIGATKDGFASALGDAKADMTANGTLVKGTQFKPFVGLLRTLPFIHENRPVPSKYQNQ